MHPFYLWHEIISFVCVERKLTYCLILPPIIVATGYMIHGMFTLVLTKISSNIMRLTRACVRPIKKKKKSEMGKYVYTVMNWYGVIISYGENIHREWSHHHHWRTLKIYMKTYVIYESDNNINKHNLMSTSLVHDYYCIVVCLTHRTNTEMPL